MVSIIAKIANKLKGYACFSAVTAWLSILIIHLFWIPTKGTMYPEFEMYLSVTGMDVFYICSVICLIFSVLLILLDIYYAIAEVLSK